MCEEDAGGSEDTQNGTFLVTPLLCYIIVEWEKMREACLVWNLIVKKLPCWCCFQILEIISYVTGFSFSFAYQFVDWIELLKNWMLLNILIKSLLESNIFTWTWWPPELLVISPRVVTWCPSKQCMNWKYFVLWVVQKYFAISSKIICMSRTWWAITQLPQRKLEQSKHLATALDSLDLHPVQ